MAHYAFLDDNNCVTEIITGVDESKFIDDLTPEEWYENFRGQKCVRTSYNGKIRKNYAGIGFTYDQSRNAFIAPKLQCHPLIVTLDEATCQWTCSDPSHEVKFP